LIIVVLLDTFVSMSAAAAYILQHIIGEHMCTYVCCIICMS